MKKKIAIFALSIFALSAVYTINAKNKEVKEAEEVEATNECIGVKLSCGFIGAICNSKDFDYDYELYDRYICGEGGKSAIQGDSGGPL